MVAVFVAVCVISVCVCSVLAGVFSIKRSGSTVSNYFQFQRAAVLHSKMPPRYGVRNQLRFVMDSKDFLRDLKVTNEMKVSPMSDDQPMPLVSDSTPFFKTACLPIIDCTLPADGFIVDFKRDAHAISRVLLNGGNVHAYVLPLCVNKWPSFHESKQGEEPNKHIFFHRVGPSSIGRFDETVRLLLLGNTVVVAGLSGTGKSTEVNAMLMKFLGNLGAEGWPSKVAYRYGPFVDIFSRDKAGHSVVETKFCLTLQDVLVTSIVLLNEWEITQNSSSSKPVLFLEVTEKEKDPDSYLPTLVYLSNRKIYGTTKTFYKTGAYYLLFDPPSREDVVSQAVFLGRVANDTRLLPDEVRPTNSDFRQVMTEKGEAMIKTEMCRRFDTIGPKSRFLFRGNLLYDLYATSLIVDASKVFNVLDVLSVNNLPQQANMFIGPFVTEGVTIPYLHHERYEIRFLSDYTAKLIGAKADTEAKQILLNNYRFKHEVLEAVLRHILTLQPSSSKSFDSMAQWSLDKVKFFTKSENSSNWISHHGCPEGLEVCNSSLTFPKMVLEVDDMSSLTDNVLYYSSVHNGILVDAFTVNHTTKKVYGFQVSDTAYGDHKYSYSTLSKFMRALKIIESGYKLVYIYVMNADAGQSGLLKVLHKPSNEGQVSNEGKKTGVVSETEKKAVDDHLENGWLAEIQVYPSTITGAATGTATATVMNEDSLSRLTVPSLRILCNKAGIPTLRRKKAELIKKLRDNLARDKELASEGQ